MTITVTWSNIYKLTGLVVTILALMLAMGSFIVQQQFEYIDKRMDDRLTVYMSDQSDLKRRIELLEQRR